MGCEAPVNEFEVFAKEFEMTLIDDDRQALDAALLDPRKVLLLLAGPTISVASRVHTYIQAEMDMDANEDYFQILDQENILTPKEREAWFGGADEHYATVRTANTEVAAVGRTGMLLGASGPSGIKIRKAMSRRRTILRRDRGRLDESLADPTARILLVSGRNPSRAQKVHDEAHWLVQLPTWQVYMVRKLSLLTPVESGDWFGGELQRYALVTNGSVEVGGDVEDLCSAGQASRPAIRGVFEGSGA